MRSFLIITLTILVSLDCFSQNNESTLWTNANRLYENQAFDSAKIYYEILAKDNQSAALFYNLGNTYYKLNNVGRAVLNYERALKLDPSNTKILDNLYLTQNRIANRIPPTERIFFIRWWLSITHASNATLWAILALLVFIAIIVLHLLKKLKVTTINTPYQATIAAFTLWLTFLVFSIYATNNKYYNHNAVVMESNASFTLQPGSTKNASLIPEGTKVNLEQTKGSWQEVVLPDGRKGWMDKTVLVKI